MCICIIFPRSIRDIETLLYIFLYCSILILYLILYEQHFDIYILFIISIYLFLDVAILIHVMLWQIDSDLWFISHICTLIYLLPVFVLKRKRKIVPCTLVLRVPTNDILPIIRIHTWTHQCDLGLHRVVSK